MTPIWVKTITELESLSTPQLRRRYQELFGEPTNAANKTWLLRRIAWRLQVQAEGGLSERAQRRAEVLTNEADLRLNPPMARKSRALARQASHPSTPARPPADRRLPVPGTLLTRTFKGERVQVKVLPQGLEYQGRVYASLTAVAKAITGSHCNGYFFFRLGQYGGKS